MAKPKSLAFKSPAVRVWETLQGPLWRASVEQHLLVRLLGRDSERAAVRRLSGCGKATAREASRLERMYSFHAQLPERHCLGSSCQTRGLSRRVGDNGETRTKTEKKDK